MKKQFKLIKQYPDSGVELGEVLTFSDGITEIQKCADDGDYWVYRLSYVEDYPEFWAEIRETEKLCVPIGTKFFYVVGQEVFTIDSIKDTKVNITWSTGSVINFYTIKDVNKNFADGTWKIYEEKPVLFVTEDGKEIREGDNFWVVTESFEIKYWDFKIMDSIESNIYYFKGKKRFSTKELAQKYIDMNKPIYSKEQVLKSLEKMHSETRRSCLPRSYYEKFLP